MSQQSPEFEQQTFIVLDPYLNQIGVVYARDTGEAILRIPPNHGLLLDEGMDAAAKSIGRILDISAQQN